MDQKKVDDLCLINLSHNKKIEMNSDILKRLDIRTLNEMQKVSIQSFRNHDVLLTSPTGSGKTLAFLLSVLERLDKRKKGIQAIVVVPSRELAQQIEQVWKRMQTGFKVNCFYGGHSIQLEKNSLMHPPTMLVGTPGRLSYHIRHGYIDTQSIHILVLDEFDKSLELGFQDEMSFIINRLERLERRFLSSATFLSKIPHFAALDKEAIRIDYIEAKEHQPQLHIKAVSTLAEEKAKTLFSLLCYIGAQSSLVFCNHREAVMRVGEHLKKEGLAHSIFHGAMDQNEREKALLQFRNGTKRTLICTDLASRGLDILNIDCIIHYQIPNKETFIHRNGRSARMGAKGQIFLIVNDGLLPNYLEKLEFLQIPEKKHLPIPSEWNTLFISAGKKDKINKIDIVGFLIHKGSLKKENLGLIEVLDHSAYIAIKNVKIKQLLSTIHQQRLKNKKVKIELIK